MLPGCCDWGCTVENALAKVRGGTRDDSGMIPGSTDLRLSLSFETVSEDVQDLLWQTRWKFHAVGQEGCKSKSRTQQLLSYCSYRHVFWNLCGISVESLWV